MSQVHAKRKNRNFVVALCKFMVKRVIHLACSKTRHSIFFFVPEKLSVSHHLNATDQRRNEHISFEVAASVHFSNCILCIFFVTKLGTTEMKQSKFEFSIRFYLPEKQQTIDFVHLAKIRMSLCLCSLCLLLMQQSSIHSDHQLFASPFTAACTLDY